MHLLRSKSEIDYVDMKLKMNNLYFEDFKYPNDYFEIFICSTQIQSYSYSLYESKDF